MTDIFHYISIILLTALKFIPGAMLASGTLPSSPVAVFFLTSSGAMLGVVFFTFFGAGIRKWLMSRKERVHPSRKKIRRVRYILKIWKRFGIIGIALLTPPLFTPPGGSLIAVLFGEKPSKIIVYMGISIAAWSFLFAFLGDLIPIEEWTG